MARPRHALAQSPAAVVRPLTCWRAVMMIVPAPRKPMPFAASAPKRDTSCVAPMLSASARHGPWSIWSSCRLSSTVSVAPSAVSI